MDVGLDGISALLDRELQRQQRVVGRVAGCPAVREYQGLACKVAMRSPAGSAIYDALPSAWVCGLKSGERFSSVLRHGGIDFIRPG